MDGSWESACAIRAKLLLTRGGEMDSTLIAGRTEGLFSHAGFCVNRSMTFKSDKDMIGFRLIRYLETDTEGVALAQIPGEKVVRAALYRHPLMERVSADNFVQTLVGEMDESYGKD